MTFRCPQCGYINGDHILTDEQMEEQARLLKDATKEAHAVVHDAFILLNNAREDLAQVDDLLREAEGKMDGR
jgi:hypothetical protein